MNVIKSLLFDLRTIIILQFQFHILTSDCQSSVFRTVPSFLIRQYSYSAINPDAVVADDGLPLRKELNYERRDDRLLLTPFLERNFLNAALELAELKYTTDDDVVQKESYSGYLTVDENFASNLYFWFFPSLDNSGYAAPLILWLQGGPGISSLYGLFEEIGPFRCNGQDRCTLIGNPYTWNKNNSLLFIDSPVGTGFSFTEHENGYATDLKTVSQHLYKALLQFFQLFPEYRISNFFIAGESFAGKFVPSLAFYIHNRHDHDERINLKGIMVGSGFTDPSTMLVYGEYLYQLGLIDDITKRHIQKLEKRTKKVLTENDYMEAYALWDGIVETFLAESKFNNVYNVLNDQIDNNLNRQNGYVDLIQTPEMRKLLHVGRADFCNLGVVYGKLLPEFMTSVRSELKTVVGNYRVLYYNGQFDVVAPYPATVNLFDKINYNGKAEYRKSRRKPWYVNGSLAGYTKSNGNLTVAVVRNAGHSVPKDQPEWTSNLISSFVRNLI